MQMKHIIIFALAGFVILIAFNMMSGSRHNNNRVALSDSDATAQPAGSADIASQPLGEQPKAVLDSATAKIDQAQQADKDRLGQMGNE